MNTLNTIYHLARADFLERTRRQSFLVTLVLIVFMAYVYVPSSQAGYITLSVDGARGIYNSQWVANLVAIMVGLTMPGLGFFLVKNAIARDKETGVGQILATTPLKRLVYTIGKWLSNLSVLSVMLAVIMLATIILQFALGEDRHIEFTSLITSLVWIILPTLALVAGIAILFETMSWLSGGFGNIVYFFVATASTMASFMPVMIAMREPAIDILGIGRPLAAMLQATVNAVPGLDAGNNSIGPVPSFIAGQPLQTFVWGGIQWSATDIAARLIWIGVGLVIVLFATLFFTRFDPSRSRFRKLKAAPAGDETPAKNLSPSEKSLDMHLSPLPVNQMHFTFGRILWAEMRLIRKGLSIMWWLVAIGLFVAGMLVSPINARLYVLPATWLWPVLAWSQLGARERQYRTESLVFSTAAPLRRQLLAIWLAGVLLTGLTGGGVLINFLQSGEGISLVTWFLAVLFIPTLALTLATWSGSSKLFEVVYLAIWYFGPMNHLVSPVDFLSTSAGIQIFYLFVIVVLSGLVVTGRRKQLNP